MEQLLRDADYGSKIHRNDVSVSVDDLVINVRGLMAKVGMRERGERVGPSEEFFVVDDACEHFAERLGGISLRRRAQDPLRDQGPRD